MKILIGFALLAAACGGKEGAGPPDSGPPADAYIPIDADDTDATVHFDAQLFDVAHFDATPGQLSLGALTVTVGTGGTQTGKLLRAQDQGLLVAGSSGTKGFLLHLDDGGVTVWQADYPMAKPLRVARQGAGYLVGGTIQTSVPWLAGVDASGALAWQERLGTTAGSVDDVVATADGAHTYVLGQGIGPTSLRSFEIVEVNASGGVVSDATYTSLDPLEVHALERLSDGSFVVGGAFDGATTDGLVARVTAGGVAWQQRFDHLLGAEVVRGVAAAADGSICVAGTTLDVTAGNTDVWAAKLGASNGTPTWQKVISGMNADAAIHVLPRGTGCVIVGTTGSAGTGNGDLLALELGADGSLVLGATFAGSGGQNPAGLVENGDGYVLAAYQVGGQVRFYTSNGSLLIPGCSDPTVGRALPQAALIVTSGAWTGTAGDLSAASFSDPTIAATSVTSPAQEHNTATAICSP